MKPHAFVWNHSKDADSSNTQGIKWHPPRELKYATRRSQGKDEKHFYFVKSLSWSLIINKSSEMDKKNLVDI